jgi:excisionase family DNA binding protein
MPPLLVTVDEAAALLQVSRNQVYRLIHSGMLPSLTIGRWRRISVKALDIYVNGALAG